MKNGASLSLWQVLNHNQIMPLDFGKKHLGTTGLTNYGF
jgi:hypothetical protein